MCDINELVTALRRLSPHIPASQDFWSVREIAYLLKRSEYAVRDHIVHLPGFPRPYRLPNRNKGRSHPLWKAAEVLLWLEKHKEKR